MKYKNRTHAKHKYKQAILATVATMTLGVSTLGSTVSAFAEEKDKNATQQQNTVQPKTTGSYYENDSKLTPLAKIDTWVQDLSKGGAANYKTTLGIAEKALPTIYKDLTIGNFNNTARSLTMLGTALIPYGGAFISPIVSLIWPENTAAQDSKVQQMVEGLISMMDQKIENYDLAKLKTELDALRGTLKKFENSVNNKPQSVSQYDSIQAANCTYADIINTSFERILKTSATEGYQVAELPIFTIVATAHLQFLHYMENNAIKHPKIQMDSEHFSRYFSTVKKTSEKYKNYINDVNNQLQKSFHDKTGGHITTADQVNAFTKIMNLQKITSDNEAFLLVASGKTPSNTTIVPSASK
ncbi:MULTISPECIES: insecticidal delta-endotoxin Cry8Ea1 family protein [Bacillus cereus group]|uniref:insecticidal delta-endotoxin Cry8Ea1 family protein n=1 Tax=Bacillus cereus group TaxID=86661 RepID=UPI000D94506B|nr:insecticidal delta-endotoxin Cry8Ea1 family protein [Bacillus cereus]MCU4946865.1 insecticidal delta-endotoxin Cry8Ea1 family protein [Bacillus cereus]SPT76312.1 delta endotoxin, N-terminal domain [Bacillus cereus]